MGSKAPVAYFQSDSRATIFSFSGCRNSSHGGLFWPDDKLNVIFRVLSFLGSKDNMDVIFGFLSFSDKFRHIIYRIPIYGFKDINYFILNKKDKKIK